MQFGYVIIKLDLRASSDYEGNKVDLPSRTFGAITMNVRLQIKGFGYTRSKRATKPKSTEYKVAKLEIKFGDKYLPNLHWHDEIWMLLDWNCTTS